MECIKKADCSHGLEFFEKVFDKLVTCIHGQLVVQIFFVS